MQVLHSTACPPGGFAVLTSLGRLARLAMSGNTHLPGCLPQLTSLEELCLDEACNGLGPDEAVDALNEALQQLTGVSVCGWVSAAAAVLLEGCIAAF